AGEALGVPRRIGERTHQRDRDQHEAGQEQRQEGARIRQDGRGGLRGGLDNIEHRRIVPWPWTAANVTCSRQCRRFLSSCRGDSRRIDAQYTVRAHYGAVRGTSRVTTALAPTIAPRPMRTGPSTFAPAPMKTLSSITARLPPCSLGTTGSFRPMVTWCITVTRLPSCTPRSITMP